MAHVPLVSLYIDFDGFKSHSAQQVHIEGAETIYLLADRPLLLQEQF